MAAPPTARMISTTPMVVTAAALKIGMKRVKASLRGTRSSSFDADTTATPIAISTAARPMLNDVIKSSPYATRCSAIAESKTTSAEGQGTMPPEIPSAISDFAVIGPSGTW